MPPDRFYPETRPLVMISALVGDAVALQKRLCEQFPESTIQPQLRKDSPLHAMKEEMYLALDNIECDWLKRQRDQYL